jgi:isochorismate synthase EntC
VFAGAGLVAASDPLREAAETRLKLGALREPLEAACAR